MVEDAGKVWSEADPVEVHLTPKAQSPPLVPILRTSNANVHLVPTQDQTTFRVW